MSINDQGFNQFINYFKMKKSILNLGKALNKAEQKSINGGAGGCNHMALCFSQSDCGDINFCQLKCGRGRCRAL